MSRFSRVAAASLMAVCLIAFVPATGWAQLHTAHDHIPEFAANPTIQSAANGPWSSPSTWTPSRLPAADDIVSTAEAAADYRP